VKRRLLAIVAAIIGTSAAIPASSPAGAKETTGEERAETAGRSLLGSFAPKLVVKTIDGQLIDLGKLYGKKAVYLKFWATWCVPCREQMPHFEHAYETAGPDLAVIAVDIGLNDPLEDVQKFRRESGIKMPIVIDDGSLGEAFHMRVTPQHVVIGRDGRVQYVGHLADKRLDDALVAARMPATASLQPAAGGTPGKTAYYGVGDQLPNISATTLDGNSLDFQDSQASVPTVLVFMDAFCEWYLETSRPDVSRSCRAVREQVQKLATDGPRVHWVGIASGVWTTKDDLSDYRVKYDPEIPLTLDESGALFRRFRIASVPTVLIVNARGKIVRRIEGFDPGLPEELQTLSAAHGR
jgi:thiol-disulfide isomerase/thioredoxin